MTVRWIEDSPSPVRWLDGPGMLGAAPYPVCKWLPVECENWDQQSAEAQQAIKAQADLLEKSYNDQVAAYKAEGGCDATKPGRLAGALKEYLISKGGDVTKMNLDASVFGPEECAEWMKVIGHSPTIADAKAAKTSTVWNGKTISFSTVCGNNVKLPTCGGGAPPTPTGKCTNDHPDCGAAGFICVDGDCVPGCRNDGDCGPDFICVNGQCAPKTSAASSSSPLGIILLVGAAIGAIWFAVQAPAGAAGR